MKRTLLISALALTAGLAGAQAPARMEMPKLETAPVKAELARMTVKANKAMPVKKLGSYKTSNGQEVELFKMSNGLIAKRLAGKNSKLPARVKSSGKLYASSAAAIEEGFEGYDGSAYDWIPANWQDVSKATPAHVAPGKDSQLMNLTWETTGGTFTAPNSGNYMARVQVSIANADQGVVEEAQDEWLITPAVTVPDGSYLNFYLSYSPAWTRMNMTSFDFTGKNNILEVLISSDNGANWTKVWDVMEDAMKYTDDELWNDAMSMNHPYIPVLINLKDYVGKSVKVAFRYVGQSGESMCIDDVLIGKVSPIASYEDPANLMPIGLSNDGYNLKNVIGLYPAFNEVTWYNSSKMANGYSWEYADPESADGGTLFAETENLVAPKYPFGIFTTPTLTATLDGTPSTTFSSTTKYLSAGGNNNEYDQSTGALARLWGAACYDIDGLLKYAPTKETGLYRTDVFGFGNAMSETWQGIIQANNMGQSSTLVGQGTIVPKPEVPYMLSYVYAFVNTSGDYKMDPASKLKVTIYPMNDNGQIIADNILATGTCTGEEIAANDDVAIMFLQRQDGELVEDVDLTVTTALYIEMSLESNAATDNVALSTILASEQLGMKEYDTIVHLIVDGEDSYLNGSGLTFGGGLYAHGYAINLGVTNNWLFERNGKNTYDGIPAEGGSCTFNMNSFYSMEQMTNVDGEGMYDWWDVSFGEYDPQTGNQDMTFTFQALPEGVDDRRCMARVSTPGVAEVQYYMSQLRNGGVESVETSASSAQVVDGNFVVSSTAADAVKVYNVSGQLVASANLDGTAVIPAANLAKGLYVVRFNDNTVVKVMK